MITLFLLGSAPGPWVLWTHPRVGTTVRVHPKRAILLLEEDARVARVAAYLEEEGFRIWGQLEDWGYLFVEWSSDWRVDEALRRLRDVPGVRVAEPDWWAELLATPNDPLFGNQRHLPAISAPEAWDVTKGSPAWAIAVLDTGIDLQHEDLQPKLVDWGTDIVDFIDQDSEPQDAATHGTSVAGVAAAATDNGVGVAGVAWNVKILPLRIGGPGGLSGSAAIQAIQYLTQRSDVKVFNMSYGQYAPFTAERNAIRNAVAAGKTPVAAAGNDNTTMKLYPCAYQDDSGEPLVICVAALNYNDTKAGYSNYGPWVVISAPHARVTTRPGGYTQSFGGTSSAAPVVAGVAALVASVNPDWTPRQIRLKLEQTADDIYGANPDYLGQLGAGKVNAWRAVQGGGPDTAPPEVQITEPPPDYLIRDPSQPLMIRASVADQSPIARVEFYVDGQLLPDGVDVIPPYEKEWDPSAAAPGEHRIRVVAYDQFANQGYDEVRVFLDAEAPEVRILNPQQDTYYAGETLIQVQASDDSEIRGVDIFIDGRSYAHLTRPPFQVPLNTRTLSDGSHTILVEVRDIADKVATDTVTFYVDNAPPVPGILEPQPNSVLSGEVQITAYAVDVGSGLQEVRIAIDGAPRAFFVPTPGQTQFTYLWDTTTEVGVAHTIGVTATDRVGNRASAEISVSVRNDFQPPTVRFLWPPANARTCGAVQVMLEAFDNDRVTEVRLFADGSLQARFLQPPFSTILRNLPAGAVQLRAEAVDAGENLSVDVVSIQITEPTHTPPTFLPQGSDLRLRLNAEMDDVTQVLLFYRGAFTQDPFLGVAPESQVDGSYTFRIPPEDFYPTGLDYYFVLESPYAACRVPAEEEFRIPGPYAPEDVNLDGKVDERDLLVVMFLYGVTPEDPDYRVYRDPNRDGQLNQADLQQIQEAILG